MDATISLDFDPSTEATPVNRMILGHFIEHLGRCIENGIWMYKDTPRALMGGPVLERVPVDLFELIKALQPPVIRWPGGCFSDTYHWRDGIGPREKRPTRKNLAWGGIKSFTVKAGPKERNHFGTDEFLTFCERLGAEPYINVNFGTGTPAEAADWVEYCNGDKSTPGGKLRTQNGHPESYSVKYWGIGNEIWGWWEKGHCKTGVEYGRKYLKFAQAMRAVDPTIQLLAAGANTSEWNRSLLREIKGYVDFLTLHLYVPVIGILSNIFGKKPLPETEPVYNSILNSAVLVENIVKGAEEDINNTIPGGTSKCKIAFDEWGIWYHYAQVYKSDRPHFILRDALWGACVLNSFIRQAHVVTMANYAQLVNCIGMILTYQSKIVQTPHYLVFKLFGDTWPAKATRNGCVGIPIIISAPTILSEPFGKKIPTLRQPMIDASALQSEDGNALTVYCVNKHFSEHARVTIQFGDFLPGAPVRATILAHEDPFVTNTKQFPTRLSLKNTTVRDGVNPYTVVLQPHSAVSLQFTRLE